MSDHNGFRNAISILTVEWQQRGCQHCKNRRSQDYQCQAYQAKGMMNWSCRFCDKDKGVHFKGMYSKKLFCTDPRQVKVISGIQSTADANDTTAAASGGGIDKDPPSKLEEKITVEEHKEEQQAQAATVAKAVEEEHQALFERQAVTGDASVSLGVEIESMGQAEDRRQAEDTTQAGDTTQAQDTMQDQDTTQAQDTRQELGTKERENMVTRLILQHGGKELLQSRVFIVGEGRVGKTSLYRGMIGEGFQAEQPSTVGVQEEVFEVTNGGEVFEVAREEHEQWRRFDRGEHAGHYAEALARMEARERCVDGGNVPGFRAPGFRAPGFNPPGFNPPVQGIESLFIPKKPANNMPGFRPPGQGMESQFISRTQFAPENDEENMLEAGMDMYGGDVSSPQGPGGSAAQESVETTDDPDAK